MFNQKGATIKSPRRLFTHHPPLHLCALLILSAQFSHSTPTSHFSSSPLSIALIPLTAPPPDSQRTALRISVSRHCHPSIVKNGRHLPNAHCGRDRAGTAPITVTVLTCVQELAHILLVELLAYQFASPVRWIETQDVIFDASMNMERLIEIGPSPTLAGMATRTLKTKYEGYDQALGMQRQVLAYAKEGKEIYYNVDPPEPAEEAPAAAAAASATPAPAAAAPAPIAAPAAPTGPAAQIDDAPVKATEIVHTVVAQKLKKSVDDVPVQKAIKDLVGGKSTLQVLSPFHLIPNP
jgi:Fatty acid synthase subunit alpha Acyl carrier domain